MSAATIGTAERALRAGQSLAAIESKDDHMQMGISTCIQRGCEGSAGEGDLQTAAVQEDRPRLHCLSRLGDRIGGHLADPCLGAARVLPRLDERRRYVG